MSAYDAVAPTFERYRALPDGVPEEVRAAIRDAIGASPRSRFLDLGAGSGRIGRAFVAAGDDYVGVDQSRGMLHEFTQRAEAAASGRVWSRPMASVCRSLTRASMPSC